MSILIYSVTFYLNNQGHNKTISMMMNFPFKSDITKNLPRNLIFLNCDKKYIACEYSRLKEDKQRKKRKKKDKDIKVIKGKRKAIDLVIFEPVLNYFFLLEEHSTGFSVFSQIPCDSRFSLSSLIENHVKFSFAKYV